MKATIEARAKINITLDILSRRPDGYHEMRMIMTEAPLCDIISIDTQTGARDVISSNLSFLPSDGRNVALAAAHRFFESASIQSGGISINIHKRIPVAAGLAGGSSNAAAVLKALNEMYGNPLDREQLFAIAAEIGSDVPFCLLGGTAMAEGRGERLKPLPSLPDCKIVLCKPSLSFSTRAMFEKIDCSRIRNRPDTEGVLKALESGDLGGIARRLYNVFENFLPEGKRDILSIKTMMLDEGALGAVMSGSGPTVYGIFNNSDYAKRAYDKLRENYLTVFMN